MTDLVVAVRLKADGSGLVGQLAPVAGVVRDVGQAAAEATAQAKGLGAATGQAAAGAREMAGTLGQAGAAAQAMAAEQRQVSAATDAVAVATGGGARATAAATAATDRLFIAQQNLEAALGRLALAQQHATQTAENDAEAHTRDAVAIASAEARVASATLAVEDAQKRASRAANDNTGQLNRQGYAIRNVGQQVGDFGLQVASGQDVARAFGQQVGQLGYALSEMGGAAGRVGAFLTGPWGIALTIASAVMAPFVEQLLETKTAADNATGALKDFGDYQGNLGNFISKTTGKLIEQNRQLVIGAVLFRQKAREEANQQTIDVAGQAFDAVRAAGASRGRSSFREGATDHPGDARLDAALVGAGGNVNRLAESIRALAATDKDFKPLADQVSNLAAQADFANRKSRDLRGELADLNTVQKGGSVLTAGLVAQQIQLATANDAGSKAAARLAIAQSKLNDLFSTPSSDARTKAIEAARDGVIAAQKAVDAVQNASKFKARKPADNSGLLTSTRNDIASLTAAFTDAPTYVEKARAAVAKLQGDIDQLAKKRPPGFEALIASAREAQGVIEANITRPFNDYIRTQRQALTIGQLTLTGHADQAAALREIITLERQIGPLTAGQRDGVLAVVQAQRLQARELDILREKNQKYLTAIGGIKAVVEDATQAFVRGDLGQLIKSPKKLLDVFQTLQGQAIFDKLFSGVFRDLQDQVNGVSTVKGASDRMASSVDQVSDASVRTADAFSMLATAAIEARIAFDGTSGKHTLGGGKISDQLYALLSQGNGNPEDITVFGKRKEKSQTELLFGQSLGKVATGIVGLFTNNETAKTIGTKIGTFAGKGFEGAATGAFVSNIAGAVGINLNKQGSTIGGAVGGVLSGIKGVTSALGPLGAALTPVLSIVGGLIGNLFGSKKTNGSASVQVGSNGQFQATAGTGATAELAKQANVLATSLAGGLQKIADALGGGIAGVPGVTIGVNNGNFHVNAVGGQIGKKGSGDVNFGQDQAGAISYAIQQEIAKGAVTGLSAAVAKALQSSTDVDAAVNEALKTANLETLLGGVTGQLGKIFKDYQQQANDRVRIAKAYGLDLLAVEKLNAQQRVDLIADTLKSRIGSLQDLLSNLNYGDLFEGTPAEQRAAIQKKIDAVTADAEAGKAGAADQVADLYRQLISTSKDAFGTAGPEYNADRGEVTAGIQHLTDLETARVNDAAKAAQATSAGIDKIASLTDETNSLLAVNNSSLATANASLASTNAAVAGILAQITGISNPGLTARFVTLR